MLLVKVNVSSAKSGSYGTVLTFSCDMVPSLCIVRTPILANFVPVWANVTLFSSLSGEPILYTLWLCPSINATGPLIFFKTPALVFSSKASPKIPKWPKRITVKHEIEPPPQKKFLNRNYVN